MTDPTPTPSKAAKVSPLVWWVSGGVVLALVVGGFALAGLDDEPASVADGPQLNISVVAPTEPDIQPGAVMDVGVLNNGFDGRLPEQAQRTPEGGLYADQPAYTGGGDQGWQAEDRWAPGARPGQNNGSQNPGNQNSGGQPNYVQPGPNGDPYANRRPDRPQREAYQERPMAFGFDRPQPDWRAEREARRAALDARERERNARDRRYAGSNDPRNDPRYSDPRYSDPRNGY